MVTDPAACHRLITYGYAEASATSGTVHLGDKKLGLLHYSQFNATYIPDVIDQCGGRRRRPP